MEARSFRSSLSVAILVVCAWTSLASAQFGRRQQFEAHSQNFIVFASSPQWATQVAEMAELNRRDLAIHWLGEELPPWSERVPIHVEAGPNLGAGGETRFTLLGGNRVGHWLMSVSGTQERILDSVLPHEITHTIFASHFASLGKYVPRWADEGACTTVEHISEKQKHQEHLQRFLRTGHGLAFNTMFSLKEYPNPILPLYAQGHSAVQFLLDQGGPRKFVKFLERGMKTEAWTQALSEFYAYESIVQFQTLWNQWLADGSPENIVAYAPGLQNNGAANTLVAAVPATTAVAGASAESVQWASGSVPVNRQAGLLSLSNPQVNLPSDPLALTAATPANSIAGQTLGNESWYKRRLREVSGDGSNDRLAPGSSQAPTQRPLAVGASIAMQPATAPAFQAASRPGRSQSVGVKVLDWGDSQPVPGIEQQSLHSGLPLGNSDASHQFGMRPIYR